MKWISLSSAGLLMSLNGAVAQDLGDLHEVKNARTRRASSVNPDPTSNYDFIRLKAGESATICDVEGPGLITHIWFTLRTDDNYANRNVVVRAWRDDGPPCGQNSAIEALESHLMAFAAEESRRTGTAVELGPLRDL